MLPSGISHYLDEESHQALFGRYYVSSAMGRVVAATWRTSTGSINDRFDLPIPRLKHLVRSKVADLEVSSEGEMDKQCCEC